MNSIFVLCEYLHPQDTFIWENEDISSFSKELNKTKWVYT